MTDINTVIEYKAARWVVQNAQPGTLIHKHARDITLTLGGRVVHYKVPCILCKREMDYNMLVKNAADLTGDPRGICGPCSRTDEEKAND